VARRSPTRAGTDEPCHRSVDPFRLVDPNAAPEQQFGALASKRFAVGAPASVIDMLVAQHRCGISHLSMRVSWPGMGQDEILASIELLGREVLPVVRRRTAAAGP